jgi:hypothetical protein
MALRLYSPSEIRTFLKVLDGTVGGPDTIELMGSGAGMLAFGLNKESKDIDLTKVSSGDFVRACEKTRTATGLEIPVEIVGIFDAPYAMNPGGRFFRIRASGTSRSSFPSVTIGRS